MMLMIICYFYAFFFADIISLLSSLKAFELLFSIKAVLNYANDGESSFFASAVASEQAALVYLPKPSLC